MIIGQLRKHKRRESIEFGKRQIGNLDHSDGEKRTVRQRQNRWFDTTESIQKWINKNTKFKKKKKNKNQPEVQIEKYILARRMVKCNLNVGTCERKKQRILFNKIATDNYGYEKLHIYHKTINVHNSQKNSFVNNNETIIQNESMFHIYLTNLFCNNER